MNFKNIRVFDLPKDFTFPNTEKLEEHLFEHAFVECSKHQRSSTGFISPFGMQSAVLAHPVGESVLLKIRVEEKILPSAAINAELERKQQAYIEQHGEPMSKKERTALKHEIAERMLPDAFTKYKDTDLYLDTKANRIIVGVGSEKAGEDVTALLRSALGSLPSKHWMGETTGPEIFTGWLRNAETLHEDFSLGADADFRGVGEDDSKHTIRKDDLQGADVKALLDDGKECCKISLYIDNQASFTLDESFGIKAIKLADILVENREDADTPSEIIDADFALWSGTLNDVINKLEQDIAGA